ncbi:MAG: YgcG family protein [Roseovarius sp.]
MRHILSVILIVFAGLAHAQSYPEPSDLAVNDFAGIISDEAEKRLSEKLNTLRSETDVELVVLTLSRQDMFAPDLSLKKFARGIFNEWGIGDKKRDDGVLVLVLREDQAIRITLGKGFGNKADKASDKAVDRSFLPEFREGRYEQGIETGVDDLISNLVGPHVKKRTEDEGEDIAASETDENSGATVATTTAQDTTADTETDAAADSASAETTAADSSQPAKDDAEGSSGGWLLYVLGGFGALIAFFVVKSKTRKCPECGARGLKTETNVIEAATETSEGRGERVTSCDACDYRDVKAYEIAKVEKPEPEEDPKPEPEAFSGGKAGKDGSTGKW